LAQFLSAPLDIVGTADRALAPDFVPLFLTGLARTPGMRCGAIGNVRAEEERPLERVVKPCGSCNLAMGVVADSMMVKRSTAAITRGCDLVRRRLLRAALTEPRKDPS
jgi:hypothetical protein